MISSCRRGDLSSHHSLKSPVGTLLSNKSPSKVIMMMGTPKKSEVPHYSKPTPAVNEEEDQTKKAVVIPPSSIRKRDLKRKCKV